MFISSTQSWPQFFFRGFRSLFLKKLKVGEQTQVVAEDQAEILDSIIYLIAKDNRRPTTGLNDL